MKNGKRLKRAQKQLLAQRNLNHENWLCERSLPGRNEASASSHGAGAGGAMLIKLRRKLNGIGC